MKKADLKSGMIVELRKEKIGLLIETSKGLLIQFENTWDTIDDYNEDLTNKNDTSLDIIIVRDIKFKNHVLRHNLDQGIILWERGKHLEFKRWYKGEGETLFFIERFENDHYYGYGFDEFGVWFNRDEVNSKGFIKTEGEKLELASDSDIRAALLKEAGKRGYTMGLEFKNRLYDEFQKVDSTPYFYSGYGIAVCGYGGVIYNDGVWLERTEVKAEVEQSEDENFTYIKIPKGVDFNFKVK